MSGTINIGKDEPVRLSWSPKVPATMVTGAQIPEAVRRVIELAQIYRADNKPVASDLVLRRRNGERYAISLRPRTMGMIRALPREEPNDPKVIELWGAVHD